MVEPTPAQTSFNVECESIMANTNTVFQALSFNPV